MFAARYIWWLLTGTALFLLALFAFDNLAALTMAISGCSSQNGGCYELSLWMMASVKPFFVIVPGVIVTAAIVIRLLWLRIMPLWIVPVVVWALSFAGALAGYLPLWHDGADLTDLLQVVPPAAFALLALAIFLAFPLEEEDAVHEQAAPIGYLPGVTAAIVTLHSVATASGLPVFLMRTFHLYSFGKTLEGLQAQVLFLFENDTGNPLPGLFIVAFFALALAYRIVRHGWLAAEA